MEPPDAQVNPTPAFNKHAKFQVLRLVRERTRGRLRGEVRVWRDSLIISNYKDYQLVKDAMPPEFPLRIRHPKTGYEDAVVEFVADRVVVHVPPKLRRVRKRRRVVAAKVLKRRRLLAATPDRRGNYQEGNPGIVRLPEGVSTTDWPAAWISRVEDEALDASGIRKGQAWP